MTLKSRRSGERGAATKVFPRKKIGEGEKIQENIVSWNQTRKHVQRREG